MVVWSQEEILEECKKCRDNPYYFATTYLKIEDYRGEVVPFTTYLSEEEFNKMFENESNV